VKKNNTEKKDRGGLVNYWNKLNEGGKTKPEKKAVSTTYKPDKFLSTKTRYESDGKKKKSWIGSLFGSKTEKQKEKQIAKTENESKPANEKAKTRDQKPSLTKKEIEEYLSHNYENRSGKSEVIKVENVFKDFILGETVINILKDVSFSVNQGDFVMLVGPSGCGKSTLLHAIYGLEEPTSGKVFIEDLDIWNENKNWRADFRNRYIGFIPQQAFWIKSFSVIENLAMPATIKGESFGSAMERAAKLIQLVNMEHRADNRPFDLSGGEQQKIAMARSLLLNPKFIIADEPTGNLDRKSGEEIMDLFKEFNEKFNITILMVTHNADQYKYANRLVQMEDGVIVKK
jgi:ABC-type lipoprotein export system ATPase subunit